MNPSITKQGRKISWFMLSIALGLVIWVLLTAKENRHSFLQDSDGTTSVAGSSASSLQVHNEPELAPFHFEITDELTGGFVGQIRLKGYVLVTEEQAGRQFYCVEGCTKVGFVITEGENDAFKEFMKEQSNGGPYALNGVDHHEITLGCLSVDHTLFARVYNAQEDTSLSKEITETLLASTQQMPVSVSLRNDRRSHGGTDAPSCYSLVRVVGL